jgi:hypothetical protein
LFELEWRWRIPRKSGAKGWKILEAKVALEAPHVLTRRRQIGAEKVAKVERQISQAIRERPSAKKNAKLTRLRSTLNRTIKSHA